MSEAALRIVTGLLGAPLVVGLVYLGGWPLVVLVMIAGLIGQREIYTLARGSGFHPSDEVGFLLGMLAVIVPVWPPAALGVAAGLLVLFGSVPFRTNEDPLGSLAVTTFGVIYPPILLSGVLYLRIGGQETLGVEGAFALTTLVLLLVWAADIGAYYVGKTFGRWALAPHVSPNKTWEGFFGGIAAALLVAGGAFVVLGRIMHPGHFAVLGLICGIACPVGDLIESRFKRSASVKDAGSILPGHGGIMDRIDGLVYSVPLAVLYLRYVAQVW